MSEFQANQLLPLNNNFYQTYGDYLEANTSINLYSLCQFGQLKNMDRILEAGAGTGSIFPLMIQGKKQSAEYHSIDISYEFLQTQQQRLEHLESQQKNGKFLNNTAPTFKVEKLSEEQSDKKEFEYHNEYFNIHLHKMNMENLTFPDNYFDGYFESLAMHHSDWSKTLKHAYRVLKSGGKLGLQEFSDEEHKKFREVPDPNVETLFKKLYQDNYKKNPVHNHKHDHDKGHGHDHNHGHGHGHSHGHQNQQTDENKNQEKMEEEGKLQTNYKFDHHQEGLQINVLSKENIVQQLEQYGYENVYLYDTFIPFNFTRENFFQCYFIGREPESPLSEEEQKPIRDEIWSYYIKPNKKDKNPLLQNVPNGMNVFCVMATKK